MIADYSATVTACNRVQASAAVFFVRPPETALTLYNLVLHVHGRMPVRIQCFLVAMCSRNGRTSYSQTSNPEALNLCSSP